MSLVTEMKSWLWIARVWILLYPVLLFLGILMGTYFGPIYYWSVIVIGVPLVVIPMTYKNLVGGGCSLRFQICALVKGMLAGVAFMVLSLLAETFVWQNLSVGLGWNPLSLGLTQDISFVWFFSGLIGGVGARIAEVRAQTKPAKITIIGFE
ncbi:hypothetical protein EU527_14715 [Candidatus Thorarchaeota archaeon]|nr:MAG: hypothetical protein EU527_14715 [Candidatus Thorarchaeota archaeon]